MHKISSVKYLYRTSLCGKGIAKGRISILIRRDLFYFHNSATKNRTPIAIPNVSKLVSSDGGEEGIRTLARFLHAYSLSRGAPSASWVLLRIVTIWNAEEKLAERVGFEPTAHCWVTGFQDQLLKPLGHLSSCYPHGSFLQMPRALKW